MLIVVIVMIGHVLDRLVVWLWAGGVLRSCAICGMEMYVKRELVLWGSDGGYGVVEWSVLSGYFFLFSYGGGYNELIRL